MSKQECPKVERQFLTARLEAESLSPARIDFDEGRYHLKYGEQRKAMKMNESRSAA